MNFLKFWWAFDKKLSHEIYVNNINDDFSNFWRSNILLKTNFTQVIL